MAELDQKIQEARAQLDAHALEIVKWHFSPETGCPFWLDWVSKADSVSYTHLRAHET